MNTSTSFVTPGPPPGEPSSTRILSLPERAEADLRRIRDTMAASRTFTHISGPTLVGLGVLGSIAGILAVAVGPADVAGETPAVFWTVWTLAGVLGFAIGFLSIDRRARRPGEPLGAGILRGAGRRFTFGMLPPLVAGALVTPALLDGGARWIPGLWLLLYGIALISGGMTSLPVVRVLGAAFVVLGTVALHVPAWGSASLVAGFGGLHIGFGAWITVRQRRAPAMEGEHRG